MTEIENMRHKVIEVRQEIFNHNEHEVSKRWTFEEGVSFISFSYKFANEIIFHDATFSKYFYFFVLLDQATLLPRQSLGEDTAKQLEGVLGL